MDKKRASETGIRVELLDGTHSGVAVDALVDDILHDDARGALKELHDHYLDGSEPEAPLAPA